MTDDGIRPLAADEAALLGPFLDKLADHHNRVAASFTGVYPTMPVSTHLVHMKEHIANDTALILGLFANGRLAGFAMASREGGYGEIDYLYIEEDLRGKGLGRELVERLLAYLRERGVSFVDLKVVLGNPAREFYRQCGFTPRSEVLSMRL